MDTIFVACPSGHQVPVLANQSEAHVLCPQCDGAVEVPGTRASLSDTGVMRILEASDLVPMAQSSSAALRPCPECQTPVAETLAVCNHCNAYLANLPDFLRDLR